jgi:hypothetical protein
LICSLAVSGCTTNAGLVSSPRTPTEQLLLTQSLLRTLDQLTLPLKPGDSVRIDAAWPPTHAEFQADATFAGAVLTSWLAQQGTVIGGDHPTYRAKILLHAFGLERTEVFCGMPAVQSMVLPFSLPELTLYRSVRRLGYTRLSVDIVDEASGRVIGGPSLVEAAVYHDQFTLLFVLSWTSTDLVPPPL